MNMRDDNGNGLIDEGNVGNLDDKALAGVRY